MNTKIAIIVAALALPLTAAAFPGAQPGDSEEHRAQRVERLAEKLDLNAEQKTQVTQIFQQQREKQEALRQETHQRLQEVLRPEQMTQFDELKKERHAKWKKHQGERGHLKTDAPAH